MLVGLIVVRMESRHFVKSLAHVVPYLFLDTNLLLKQIYFAHGQVFVAMENSLFNWVLLMQIWDHSLVNL